MSRFFSKTTVLSGCPVKPNVPTKKIESSPSKNSIEYRLHDGRKLSALYKFGECRFLLEGRKILEVSHYGAVSGCISRLGTITPFDLFLIRHHSGDNCPGQFRVLHFSKGKKPYISDPFGTCASISSITFFFDEILFSFHPYRHKLPPGVCLQPQAPQAEGQEALRPMT